MALSIYDTLEPKGNFPAVKAKDVVMPDGTRLSDFKGGVSAEYLQEQLDALRKELETESGGGVGMATLTRAQYDALAGAGALNESGHYMIVKVQTAYRPTGLEDHQMAILAGAGLLPESDGT